jgi:signal peptidase I
MAGILPQGCRLSFTMRSHLRTLRREIVPVLTACAVVLVARASLADHYHVPSGSMEPTVAVGDHVCVNKAAYGLRLPASELYVVRGPGPARGDVVVLTSPADGEVLLKRVVAVPGDRVEVRGGHVVLNGVAVPVSESLETLGAHTHPLGTEFGGGPDFGPTDVPADDYLVLGDNRGNSRDGREIGWVKRGAILGRAEAVCARDGQLVWRPL